MIEAENYLMIPRHISSNRGLINELAFGDTFQFKKTFEFIGTHCPICFLSVVLLKVTVVPFISVMEFFVAGYAKDMIWPI